MWQLKSGVLLVAATLIGACGGAAAVPTAPGAVSNQGAGAGVAAQVVQPSASSTSMKSSGVHGHALISTSATNGNCQPGDPLGLDRPSVTLPAPVPIVQFGSRLTEVRTTSRNLRGTSFVGSTRVPRLPADCFR